MARRRLRVTNRFYVFVVLFVSAVVFSVLLLMRLIGKGEIEIGSMGAELDVSAALVRDETVVSTENYEKVIYNVIEGQAVSNEELIAQVYKRGYQDETMVSLLNLQKEIYRYQLQLLAGAAPEELLDVNGRIEAVQEQMRLTAREDGAQDMLALEQQLKELLGERIDLLRRLVTADNTLTTYYAQLESQTQTLNSWKRNIVNTAGNGVVSFYFDGYEQALNVNKLSTINSALVTSVIKNSNTAKSTGSGSERPLYRLITNTHWYIVFVTESNEAFRLSNGEKYYVTFGDYSDQVYEATAHEPVVSEQKVVNILEFFGDIGKLVGIRTVNATISTSAQGLMVPLDVLEIVDGIAGINIKTGDDTVLRVEVDVLAEDGKRAIIRARNESDTLAVGQKYIKP